MPAPLKSGLLSITFRQLDRAAIVKVAADAGLDGIEWGGDVHVPPGDLDAARDAARLTADRDLTVAAYGSYYRCEPGGDFAPVLDAAEALGAPLIRVWAGRANPDKVNCEARQQTADEIRRVTDLAAARGVLVAAEWHGGTLTDTLDSGVALAKEVGHDGFRLYWQPSRWRGFDERMAELKAVLPWLAHLHVFQWTDVPGQGPADRHPLAGGEADWSRYLKVAATAEPVAPGADRFAMLEFVPGDNPQAIIAEGATLQRLLREAQA